MTTHLPKVAEASRLSSPQDQKKDASATVSSAPKGRNIPAQGIALGNRQTTNPSPEGAAHGWRTVKIGDIAAEVRYGSSSKTDENPDGVPVIRMGNIINGSLDFEKLKYLPSEHPEFPLLLLEPGDILFNRTNSAELVGKTAVYRGYPIKCSFASYLIRVRLNEGIPEWVSYYLNSSYGRSWIKTVVSQQCGQANVNGSKLKELEIPFPPVEEQRRIVARIEELFSRLDAGVAALRHAKAQLQRYRQSVLAAAVTGQLTQAWREQHPDTETAAEYLKAILKKRRGMWEGRRKYAEPATPDTDDLPKLPSSWTWATVAQQSDPDERSISDGPFGSKLKSSHYTDSGPRVFRLQNIGDGFFKDEYAHISEEHFKTLSNHGIFSGDLLIKALGIPAHQTCMVPPGVGPAIVKADCIRFKVFEPYINPKFALLALNSHPVRARSEKLIHGVGRPRLNGSEIKQIALPFPPLAEQHQIVAEVEARTTAIDHLEAELDRQITRSNRLRQSILASAFSGTLNHTSSCDGL
jgi:type I restriction enzyme, S subunit